MNINLQYQALKDEKDEWTRKADQANRTYQGGLWGVLIGLILVFVPGIWPLGLLLLIAGGLAALTQMGKRGEAREKVAELEKRMQALVNSSNAP